jgi:hypothetical protein
MTSNFRLLLVFNSCVNSTGAYPLPIFAQLTGSCRTAVAMLQSSYGKIHAKITKKVFQHEDIRVYVMLNNLYCFCFPFVSFYKKPGGLHG